jgi:predicted PurR-regulated permease PerM
MNDPAARRVRRIVVHSALALLMGSAAVYLLWSLRSLIVPLVVGALLAYLVKPLVRRVERRGLSHGAVVALFFVVFVLLLVLVVEEIQAVIPHQQGRLELRVRVLYKLDQRYQSLMGLNESLTEGNALYDLFGDQADPVMDRIRWDLFLNPKEQKAFEGYRAGAPGSRPVSDTIYQYYLADLELLHKRAQRGGGGADSDAAAPSKAEEASAMEIFLDRLKDVLSLWVITPITFLFFLIDQGEIKRGLIGLVPNTYFEPTLNVLRDLDEAVGSYLRGVLLECSLVGLTLMILLRVVGLPTPWPFLIALLSALLHIIPYAGAVIGFGLGVFYALLAEQVNSLLPFVNVQNLWVWVSLAVIITELIDNAVFQPYVLGGAVELHPLLIAVGVLGASLLFGLAGAVFAVPTIAVGRVFLSSSLRELKAYSII